MLLVELNLLPNYKHGDILLMSLASAQMGWCFVNYPETIEPGYLRFLLNQAGFDKIFLSAFRELNSAPAFSSAINLLTPSTLKTINSIRQSQGYPPYINIPNPKAYHEILHPHTTFCFKNFIQHTLKGLKFSIPVYLPVHLIPLLIFKGKNILIKPLNLFIDAIWNIFRSSIFLSSYVAMAWYAPCINTEYFGRRGHLTSALSGLLAGLFLLIEKKITSYRTWIICISTSCICCLSILVY